MSEEELKRIKEEFEKLMQNYLAKTNSAFHYKILIEFPELNPDNPDLNRELYDLATKIWEEKYNKEAGEKEYLAVLEADKILLWKEIEQIK